MMSTRRVLRVLPALALVLTGCGNGSSGTSDTPARANNLTVDKRTEAVETTLANNSTCSTSNLGSFYWEFGDASGALASGHQDEAGGTPVLADTPLKIASATKWIFASYVLELESGSLSPEEIQALTMKTGYDNFSYTACTSDLTVQTCFEAPKLLGHNDDFTAADEGKFNYNGGHFQKLAVDLGLGDLTNTTLAREMMDKLPGVTISFDRPQLAAGIQMSGAQYGNFLRKLLDRSFVMGDRLGTEAVCTIYDPSNCPNVVDAITSSPAYPIDWHYSLGHWVEDNTVQYDDRSGDGAYNSAGAFGF